MNEEEKDLARQVAMFVAIKSILRVLKDNTATAFLADEMKAVALRASADVEQDLYELSGDNEFNDRVYAILEIMFR